MAILKHIIFHYFIISQLALCYAYKDKEEDDKHKDRDVKIEEILDWTKYEDDFEFDAHDDTQHDAPEHKGKYHSHDIHCFKHIIKKKQKAELSVTNISDLDFGVVLNGDSARTILPGTFEGPENGSFLIEGQKNAHIYLMVPNSITLTMTGTTQLAAGWQQYLNSYYNKKTIEVRDVKFWPNPDANLKLDKSGQLTIYFGGTIDAITSQQAPGNYSGEIFIQVIYN